jgi:hypothetical protein
MKSVAALTVFCILPAAFCFLAICQDTHGKMALMSGD